ncbi:MAG: hybrid sensor histidine kinase/response regulator [Planctomycetaceae bacterium]|nr:hybrid sensor histidine kinase/response regulator [Planctomycetales bacterium]MCB9926802.1 hybrid sensor histidine kinase/response regulator [Planctomycetaceae bacterium]
MDRQELAKRLMATYLEELHEHVEAMNRDLLALERGLSPEQRDEVMKVLFRSAHSLKGASRAVNVEVIENACHMMEDILSELRDGNREMTPPLFSLFFKVADAIQEVGMRLRDDQDLSDAGLHALLPDLREATASEGISKHAQESLEELLSDAAEVEETHRYDQPVRPREVETPRAATKPSPGIATDPKSFADRADKGGSVRGGSVRVTADKLDALLSQNGELLVARQRVDQRSAESSELSDSLMHLHDEWNDWSRPLRKLLTEDGSKGLADEIKAKLPRRTVAMIERTADRLAKLEKAAERLAANMAADARVLRHTCDALNDEVYRVRMLPFAETCRGLERVVRDLAQTIGKDIRLVVKGDDVEVDRSVLEGLKDPVLHLVRNAVDHGIELPEVRKSAGKPSKACITVSAELRGGLVEVSVEDDGRGFDLRRIREHALQAGIAVPNDPSELARLVFLPGFSTTSVVTDVSGRGVGLDVVASRVQALHGSVDVDFQETIGTRFIISVPLTLTTVRCLLATTAQQTYAIPTSAVHQLVRFEPTSMTKVSGGDVLLLGGTPTPVAVLADVLGQGKYEGDSDSSKMLAVVVKVAEQRVAFVVDELCAEQEVLVKSLGSRVRYARHVSGATLLPSGNVALVLNATNLVATALGSPTAYPIVIARPEAEVQQRKRVLVVDDSVTTRTLMKSILEAAGYEVTSAADGAQAWDLLTHIEVDLVVSDVDMPRMDGFTLTDKIRKSKKLGELPVILVTARASDEDRTQGVRVGASVYLVKSGFDQSNLLESIQQLI